ncbi:MAG: hypothetical protein WC413_00155 [Candidatus Nanoarchaeia archaeon]
MPIQSLKSTIERLTHTLKNIEKENLVLETKKENKSDFFDYKAKKTSYYLSSVDSGIKTIKSSLPELNGLIRFDRDNERYIEKAKESIDTLEKLYSKKDITLLVKELKLLHSTLGFINIPKELKFNLPKKIPDEIKSEVYADILEIDKCFKFKCYRSAIILCSRVLETALHRKYYEITGDDLLEKAPGIGLGKIIAKLSERNIPFDPGVTQQIHLVNQMRIFSVHNKKEAFNPSEKQTQAVILYTLDLLEKLFG